MTLPNFIIIGGRNCGTGTLYDMAIEHPKILPASKRELNFFNWRSKGEKKKGINWYLAQFPKKANRKGFITGEASPDYTMDPHTPQKMFKLVPDVKLIVMLRNPVDRAISHYYHNKATRSPEHLSFRQAIEKESERLEPEIEKLWADEQYRSTIYRKQSYLLSGIYVDRLKEWMSIFPKNNLLILKSEDVFEYPKSTMNQVFNFLGMPDYEVTNSLKNRELSTKKIEPKLRRELVKYFRPHNQRLEELLGKKFNWGMRGSENKERSKTVLENSNIGRSELEEKLNKLEEKLNNCQLELQQIRSELNSKSRDAQKKQAAKKSSIKIRVTPWLTEDAVNLLENFVKEKPDANLLEFGSGGSTIWLSKLTKKLVSIEHNKQWFTNVKNYIEKEKSCNPVDLRWLPRPYNKICDEFPDEFFDLILVDGRDRVKCLEASIRILKPGGILMLDDAQRENYNDGKELLADWQLTQSFGPSGHKHTYWWQKPRSCFQ